MVVTPHAQRGRRGLVAKRPVPPPVPSSVRSTRGARPRLTASRRPSDDFRDFLTSLNAAGVEYLLLGGHAVAHYGYVRPTTDLDVWIAVSDTNAAKLVTAVRHFFDSEMPELDKQWFLDPKPASL